MPNPSPQPRYIQSLHQPRIQGFHWVSPQDELDERIYREVLSEGCSILSFSSCATAPEFTYSVGLYLNFLHPEILLMGLHPETARGIIAKIRDDADRGLMLTPESVRLDLFEDGRPIRFRAVPQERYLDYLGRNCNLYYTLFLRPDLRPDDSDVFGFPVLQAIWPDRAGRFPDDPECDPRFVALHELVDQP